MDADVRTTEALDRLVIVARDDADRRRLRQLLTAELPDVPVRRTTEGLWVGARDADRLLDVTGVNLRWNAEARLFAQNRRRAKLVHPFARQSVRHLRQAGRPAAEPLLHGIAGLETLDDHQWVNVASMT